MFPGRRDQSATDGGKSRVELLDASVCSSEHDGHVNPTDLLLVPSMLYFFEMRLPSSNVPAVFERQCHSA